MTGSVQERIRPFLSRMNISDIFGLALNICAVLTFEIFHRPHIMMSVCPIVKFLFMRCMHVTA